MTARALGILVLMAALPAGAGERFYPVMGPDGRMQVIRSEAPAAATDSPADAAAPATDAKARATGATAAEATTAGAKATDVTAAEATTAGAKATDVTATGAGAGTTAGATATDVSAGAAANAASGQEPASAGFAPYDSDAYADSEAVEAALSREAEAKSRFYVIDDGMGSRLNEAPRDAGVLLPPARPVQSVQDAELSYPVASALSRLDGAAARQRFPGLPECLSKAQLRGLRAVQPDQPATLVLHKGIYLFLDESRLVEGYHVGGEGPRMLVARSFSRTDRNPAFAHPHLAFLDERGCLTRVVTGYYERLYPPTDDRHAMLRGEVLVHTEEAWMLVLASRGSEDIAAALPYGYSPYGQLKFTLKK